MTILATITLVTLPIPLRAETTIRYSPATGLGPQVAVMRRDPSDIIKVKDLYYVWYTKGKVADGYDATVWFATPTDGHNWYEKGEALARGSEGSRDAQSVFTPNILSARGKYWLFYTAVPKAFNNEGNQVTKTAIGLAVADLPDTHVEVVPHSGRKLSLGLCSNLDYTTKSEQVLKNLWISFVGLISHE